MGKNLDVLYAMWYRQILRFWRAKSRVVSIFTQPIFWMIFFGLGWSAAFRVGGASGLFGGIDYLTFLIPGVLMMTIFMSSFMSGMSVLFDKEFGYLKEILVAPVSRRASILGRTLGDSTIAVLQGLIITLIAYPIAPGINILNLPFVLLIGLLMSVSFASIGIIIATSLRSFEGFQLIINMISMPILLLSGVFYPISTMPEWMKAAAYINPLTYGVDVARFLLAGVGYFDLIVDIVLLIGLSTVLILIATFMFEKATID